MKKIFLTLIFFTGIQYAGFSQAATRTFFAMPISIEDTSLKGDFYMSINFTDYHNIPLDDGLNSSKYSHGESVLWDVFHAIRGNNKAEYLNKSTGPSEETEGSFNFYNYFISHSTSPKLDYAFDEGELRIYFIELTPDYPDIAFGIARNGNTFMNAPALTDNSLSGAITAIAQSMKANPGMYHAIAAPSYNTEVKFDSLYGNTGSNYVSFMFNGYKVYYNVAKPTDSLNQFPPKFADIFAFHSKYLDLLKNNDTTAYYNTMTPESRNRVFNGFSHLTARQLEDYKHLEYNYTLVNYVIDLGQAYVLVYTSSSFKKAKTPQVRYIYKKDMYWQANRNKEFYLDDLIKTPEFTRVVKL